MCAWTYNFSPHKGTFASLPKAEHVKLYMFGHGHNTLYSIWSSSWCKSKNGIANRPASRQGREHASKALLVLMLLAGDIHLNPGPTTSEQQQANSVVQVRPDIGGAAQTPPMHTPEPRRAAQWSEQLLVRARNYRSSSDTRRSAPLLYSATWDLPTAAKLVSHPAW